MPVISLDASLRQEYAQLFSQARIRPERAFEVEATIRKIFAAGAMARYRRVSEAVGVPAHVIGIIHSMEASLRFTGHLHNGDPLTARTVQVPAGRPPGDPPFEWEASAIDALALKQLDRWTDWSIPAIAFVLERYNGFGYRRHHPQVKSPYLWSFTTIYSAGKYVADGKWSDTAVSRQCGGMALLAAMVAEGLVPGDAPPPPEEETGTAATPFAGPDTTLLTPAAPPAFPGRVLRNGSTLPAVLVLQRRLAELGIPGVGGADGDFGDRTEAAVRLFQARAVDVEGRPLEVDGIVGERTWRALFGDASVATPLARTLPIPGSLSEAVLRIAAAEIGVREVPLGSNRGPRVDQYMAKVSPALQGQPWCMAFVYFCFAAAAEIAGIDNPAPRTAGVLRGWQMAREAGRRVITAAEAQRMPELVSPGMVFYMDTGAGTGHTGLVADVTPSGLVTIEGNTNDGGSREGIGVFTRTGRRIDSINLGFVEMG